MAKEYVVEKAFRQTDENKVPKEFKAHDKVMWPWKVKVEGEDFWFNKNTLENGSITPGDTMYGLFDEEEVHPKNGEPFTVKKFVRMERPDGSRDKVQGAASNSSQSNVQAPTAGPGAQRLEYAIKMLEELTGRREVTDEPAETATEDEDEPINLDDLNI